MNFDITCHLANFQNAPPIARNSKNSEVLNESVDVTSSRCLAHDCKNHIAGLKICISLLEPLQASKSAISPQAARSAISPRAAPGGRICNPSSRCSQTQNLHSLIGDFRIMLPTAQSTISRRATPSLRTCNLSSGCSWPQNLQSLLGAVPALRAASTSTISPRDAPSLKICNLSSSRS